MKRIDREPTFELTIPNLKGGEGETHTLMLSGITEEQAALIEKALQPGNRVFTAQELEAAISGVALESVLRRNRRSTDQKD